MGNRGRAIPTEGRGNGYEETAHRYVCEMDSLECFCAFGCLVVADGGVLRWWPDYNNTAAFIAAFFPPGLGYSETPGGRW